MAFRLATPRLALREATLADAGFMRALLNDPGFLANIGDRGVRSDEAAAGYIRERMIAAYRRDGFGFYVVERGGEAIGICGFVRREGLPAPDLGFAFLAAETCKGYGFEAGAAMLRHGRVTLGLDPILAIAKPGNARSIALLARLGFSDRGTIRLPHIVGPSRLFEIGGAEAPDRLGAAHTPREAQP